MKKLFFTLSVFVATTFANQVIKPMAKTPPCIKSFFIEPHFQCNYEVMLNNDRMVQLELIIQGSPNLLPLNNPLKYITILITFIPSGPSSTYCSCVITNHNIDTMEKINQVSFTYYFEFNRPSFQAKHFFDHEVIKVLVKRCLSISFRLYILQSTICMLCKNEITLQDPAILLKCGNAAHERCYAECTDEAKCLSCNQNIKNDHCWCNLEALPAL